MPLYRICKPLSSKNERMSAGAIVHLSLNAAQLEALVRRGAISPVSGPPIAEIPSMTAWAEALRGAGIVKLEHFLETENAALAALLGEVSVETIENHKAIMIDLWLKP